ncbi:MAG: DUF2304 domain-containing protein [Acidobacteriales bacterium]|nr:MAG: DUF2304 domain-containing protein [Terriglobales bacterium]
MSMDRLLNVLAILSLVLILFVLRSLRREHIRAEYSVSWLGAALTLLVLSRTRGVLEWLGKMLGIADPPLALLFIMGCLFLVVFYRFSAVISDLKDSNIALAQKVAMLEFQLRSLNEKQETRPNP